jgi:hypothetical protein
LVHLNNEIHGREQTCFFKQSARKMVDEYRSNAELLLEGAEREARRHWPILVIEGTALVLFGILALFIPPLITLGIASALAWVFLSAGVAAMLVHFRSYRAQGLRYLLFSAVLSAIVGFALLVKPLSGVITAYGDNYPVLRRRGGRETHVSAGAFSIAPELSRMDQGKRHYRMLCLQC